MSATPQTEAHRLADGLLAETSKFGKPSIQRGLVNGAIQELRRLDAENKAMQSKLDADLALITKQADLLLDQKQAIYSFHYAMKDAGEQPEPDDHQHAGDFPERDDDEQPERCPNTDDMFGGEDA